MKNKMASCDKYICTTCGKPAEKLYTKYKGDIIKIAHCTYCDNVVDKYVEYDLVITSLDAMLLKRQAFRHILMNSGIKAHWKFCLVLLICDAFTRLMSQRTDGDERKWLPDHVIYSALEVDLYWNFFLAVVELFAFLFGVLMFLSIWGKMIQRSEDAPGLREAACGLMLSHFGKILVLPAILWGQRYSALFVWLSHVFTLASNIQASRVLYPKWNPSVSVLAVLFGYSLVYGTQLLIPQELNDT